MKVGEVEPLPLFFYDGTLLLLSCDEKFSLTVIYGKRITFRIKGIIIL